MPPEAQDVQGRWTGIPVAGLPQWIRVISVEARVGLSGKLLMHSVLSTNNIGKYQN